jgi:hypothetical protein
MKLAINAGRGAATWIASLLFSFLAATNDFAWYFTSGDSVQVLMSNAKCTSPTLRCIREAKVAAFALSQAKDDVYWLKVQEEQAEAEQIRIEQQAHDDYIGELVRKSNEYDELKRNPPVTTTTTIINNHNHYTNTIFNTIYATHIESLFVAQSTPTPDLLAISERLVDSPFFDDDPNRLNWFKIGVILFIIGLLFDICVLCCCCCRRKTRNDRGKPAKGTVQPGGPRPKVQEEISSPSTARGSDNATTSTQTGPLDDASDWEDEDGEDAEGSMPGA